MTVPANPAVTPPVQETPPGDPGAPAVNADGTPVVPAAPEAQAGNDTRQVNKHGFPDGTPVVEMTQAEQTAYWRYHSRTHEERAKAGLSADEAQELRDEVARLKNAALSADQIAANEAIETAKSEAREAARAELMPVIHESQLLGYASTVISGDRLQAWVQSANPAHFLDESGAIDGAKVQTHLTALFGEKETAPTTPRQQYPNFGQGATPGGSARPQRGAAGAAEAAKRFKTAA
ncbi:hypothetical protein PXH69_24205 [Rhodococcus qingshengii]|uniref:Scaffolding protein n=1 Tax=Rhodococcus qingshengii TaxID=334542 RepID=A0AAW6LPI9_RHOSG|nr:hypothetical protein [Rhodococcus qingshengii]MDE8648086.1 hypothetical protein [Rhodococcus qingshengii]